jgi:AcrR family transcriptional regulator
VTQQAAGQRIRPPRRRPNRRGEGGRLREDLVTAAITMIETPDGEQVSLRSIARTVGIAATSVYLHFPDVDHLLAAVMQRGFDQLTEATATAADGASGPVDELRRRCRAYCHFALGHPRLYQVMFQADLPALLLQDPTATPGRRSFENLVTTVTRCLQTGAAPSHDDPFRLASLIWAAEHGIVTARIARPTFPWAPLDSLIDEMISKMLLLRDQLPAASAATRDHDDRGLASRSSEGIADH